MVIKRLRLENFRAHKVFDKEFGKFTVIFGRNGVGKSTILEAIFKALYPDSGFGGEYIRRGEKNFKISIDFANGYTLKMIYPIDKKPKVFSPDGRILSVENLRKILDLPEDENKFLFLSFFEQGSLDDFSKEIFDNTRKILEVDFPQTILKAIEGIEREKRAKIKDIEDEIRKRHGNGNWDRNLRKLRMEISDNLCLERKIKNEIIRLQKEKKDLEELEGNLDRMLKDLRERKEKIAEIKGKISALEKSRNELEKDIDELEKKLNPELPRDPSILKDILEFLKNYKIMEESKVYHYEYVKLEEKYRSVLKEYPERIREVEGKLEKLRKFYEALKELRGRNLKNIQDEHKLKNEHERLLGEIKYHENRVKNLMIEGDRCPVCGEPLGKEKRERLLEESSKFLDEAKDRINVLEKYLCDIDEVRNLLKHKVYPALEDILKTFGEIAKSWNDKILMDLEGLLYEVEEIGRSLKRQYDEIKKEYNNITEYYENKLKLLEEGSARYVNAKNQIERLAKNLKEAEKYLKFKEDEIEDSLRILERLNNLKEHLKKLDEDLERSRKEISSEDPSDIESKLIYYDKKLDDVRKRKNEVLQRIADLERKRSEISNLRIQNENRYSEIRKLTGEMENIREGLEILKSFKNAVDMGKKKFVSYAKLAFESVLNEHFLNFFGFSDHFIKVEVDENFEPIFHTVEGVEVRRGRELSVNRVGLSGGQKTALGLVYRLALRSMFPNSPKILLLDEPTTHLDEDRRVAVWKILWKISNEKDIQLIAVTHDEAVHEVISKENIVRLAS